MFGAPPTDSLVFGARSARDKFVTKLAAEICSSGQSIKQCFDKMDADRNGKLGIDEFRAIAKQVNSNLSEYDVLVLFAEMASIGFSDFDALLTKAKIRFALGKNPNISIWARIATEVDRSGQTVQECFDSVDTNHDKKISQAELWSLMTKIDTGISADDCKFAFALVDTSSDGSITPFQFQTALEVVKTLIAAGANAKTCLQGHSLTCAFTDRDGFFCDRCRTVLMRGSYTHRCHQCDYDLCETCAAQDSPPTYIKVKRHVYNARGGAPPYRGSYLTATDTVELAADKSLGEQRDKIVPSSGFGAGLSSGTWAIFPADQEAPRCWEFPSPGGESLGAPQLEQSPRKILAGKALVVLIPMMGFD